MSWLREDIGRYSDLDKRAGALAHENLSGCDGIGLLNSRLSVVLVQKAAMLGILVLAVVSSPIALAVRIAQAVGITHVAAARNDGFVIFTHSQRIKEESHVFV
jgi:FdhD protein